MEIDAGAAQIRTQRRSVVSSSEKTRSRDRGVEGKNIVFIPRSDEAPICPGGVKIERKGRIRRQGIFISEDERKFEFS